jgi:hypothetical protein
LLSSIGRTYRVSETTPSAETETIAELYSIGGTAGVFSIVTGVGGLTIQNTAKIIDGEVRVNGSLNMDNSAQIGLTTNPVNVYVAHQSCPTTGGASYPEVCTSGEPISINNTAHIYGDVCAANQVDGSGMSDDGLNISCSGASAGVPAPEALPDHNRAAQIAAVGSTTSGDYSCSATTTQTISANTRITGDLTISGRCKIVIEGDVWVEGDLSLANRAELQVPDSINLAATVDGSYPTIMVDGNSGAKFRNRSSLVGNSADVGFQIVTYWSESPCSPDCADVTGQDLYDSRDQTTIQLLQSSKAESSILYARWSQVDLNNGGDVGAVVGQTVLLRNSASITFGAAVGGGGSSPQYWLVKGYRRN